MQKRIQLRLMDDDPDAVEAGLELLSRLIPEYFQASGSSPNHRGPGKRGFGLLLVDTGEEQPGPIVRPANPQSTMIDPATGWLRSDGWVRVRVLPDIGSTKRYVVCRLVKYHPLPTSAGLRKTYVYVERHAELRRPWYRDPDAGGVVQIYDTDLHPDDQQELEQHYAALRTQLNRDVVLTAQGAE